MGLLSQDLNRGVLVDGDRTGGDEKLLDSSFLLIDRDNSRFQDRQGRNVVWKDTKSSRERGNINLEMRSHTNKLTHDVNTDLLDVGGFVVVNCIGPTESDGHFRSHSRGGDHSAKGEGSSSECHGCCLRWSLESLICLYFYFY